MIRRTLAMAGLSALMALVPFVGTAGSVHADDFCTVDPLVTIVTPGGTSVPVHITVSTANVGNLAYLNQVQVVSTNVQSAGSGTLATVNVSVPANPISNFAYWAIASSQPGGTGTIYGGGGGMAGTTVPVIFYLNVA
jgi:hypothetical protein